ncbi:zinc finger protein 99 X3 [Biomphalaria glabrata]|nr:zinc finger protein 99 X3 [Biomphalaria glabrata]
MVEILERIGSVMLMSDSICAAQNFMNLVPKDVDVIAFFASVVVVLMEDLLLEFSLVFSSPVLGTQAWDSAVVKHGLFWYGSWHCE